MSDDRSTGFVVPSGSRAVVGVAAAVLLIGGVGLLIARADGFAEVREHAGNRLERLTPSRP